MKHTALDSRSVAYQPEPEQPPVLPYPYNVLQDLANQSRNYGYYVGLVAGLGHRKSGAISIDMHTGKTMVPEEEAERLLASSHSLYEELKQWIADHMSAGSEAPRG
jgi:hypothetical protein